MENKTEVNDEELQEVVGGSLSGSVSRLKEHWNEMPPELREKIMAYLKKYGVDAAYKLAYKMVADTKFSKYKWVLNLIY